MPRTKKIQPTVVCAECGGSVFKAVAVEVAKGIYTCSNHENDYRSTH